MEKTDEISEKLHGKKTLTNSVNDVQTFFKNRTCETSNSESVSSSYSAFSENAEGKVNTKNIHTNCSSVSMDKKSELSSHHSGLIENCSSESPDRAGDNLGCDVEKSSHGIKGSLGNHKEMATQKEKKEVGTANNGGNLPEEPSKPLGTVQDEDVPAILNVKGSSADDNDESDAVEHDVKVCDICGDAGLEDLLAICCRCIDGAEHTYCMKELMDKVPEGDWYCEECKLDEESKNMNRQRYGTEAGAEKTQSSGSAFEEAKTSKDHSGLKASSKRRLEESESFSAVKRRALEVRDSSTKKDSSEAVRPQLQSMRGTFVKSNSFNFPNARSKTKLVDEIVLRRQRSTKERTSHDTIVAREMGKSLSFRSTNLGSKVKMLSPKSSQVQELKSPKNKKESNFERSNSFKLPSAGNLSTSSSTALVPKVDKLPVSRGETTTVSSACNSEVKPLKGDRKMITGLKSSNLPGSIEQKSVALNDDNSSKLAISKESTNVAGGIKEITTNSQNQTTDRSVSVGLNTSAMRSSKEVKNGDNKLKDAIEAALLKKPGIYRKNRVSDQPDESSVSSMNNEATIVDHTPHSRNAENLTSTEMLTDWQGQILRSSSSDHYKQSNGKHATTESSTHDITASSYPLKISAIPDYEYIWQGSFEISRSGKTVEFWDGLQAHLSMCASHKVFETVNNLPQKILLNGVSRISAWPKQFENNGAKEDNIALYFFAKDAESYEKSYQVLLDDMMRGDLALIGSIGGFELLIFPSNQLPERYHRWNMLFFLWGVFRGKKDSLHQAPDHPEKNRIPQVASSIATDKISSAEDVCSLESIDKDRDIDSESKGNLKLQTFSQEKEIDSINVVPASSGKINPFRHVADVSEPDKSHGQNVVKYSRNLKMEQRSSVMEVSVEELNRLQIESRKREFIHLFDDGSASKKQKRQISGFPLKENQSEVEESGAGNSNSERHFFPVDSTREVKDVRSGESVIPERPKFMLGLDLNEDISSCLVGDSDNTIMTKKEEEEDDVSSSLSLSLSFSRADEDRAKGNRNSTPSMLLFREIIDK